MPDYIAPTRSHGLVEILDRVLDKGLVIAGDIKINLANVELLTIQVRLLVCSIDKAEQIGLNWWRFDPRLTSVVSPYVVPAGEVEARLERIERRLEQLADRSANPRRGGKPSSSE
ncbi:MAG TPA: gas vesicle protein [Gemmatimonadaceae bacterium]|nr:gas vesicle protein [Gemmatimonadaceae bacterium]